MSGQELQEWRMARGMNTAQAAELFGYSLRGWQRAEQEGATKQLAAAIRIIDRVGGLEGGDGTED